MKAPQVLILCWFAARFIVAVFRHGRRAIGVTDLAGKVLADVALAAVLVWGGFWSGGAR